MCAMKKRNMKRNNLLSFISVLIAVLILVTGVLLEMKFNSYRIEENTRHKMSLELRHGRDVDMKRLKARNEDARGWLYLPDSKIDYPLLQGEDNEVYLHHDIDGNWIYDGSLFIDADNIAFEDQNTVIYGHHMFSGAMFCGLEKFADEDYFRSHNIFQLTTEKGKYDIHVIAYCNEDADSPLYTTYFDEEFTINDFIDLILEKAVVTSDENFDENDMYVTMSTCAYNYNDARHQVIGVIKAPKIEAVEKDIYEPGINKWLILQIAIGAVMAIVLISTVSGFIKRR